MPFRHKHGGQHTAFLALPGTKNFEPPGPHGGAGGSAMARMPGEHIVEPLFVQHVDGFVQAVKQVGARCVWESSRLALGPIISFQSQ